MSCILVVNAEEYISEEYIAEETTVSTTEETTNSLEDKVNTKQPRLKGIKKTYGNKLVKLPQNSKIEDTTTATDIIQLYTIPIILIAFACGLLFGLGIMFCLMVSHNYVNKRMMKKCQEK
jgi:hypothetical protein